MISKQIKYLLRMSILIHKEKIFLLLTLFLIMSLSHPYFQSLENPTVDVKVVKRDLSPPTITHIPITAIPVITATNVHITSITIPALPTGSFPPDTSTASTISTPKQVSKSSSMHDLSMMPLLTFLGFTILLHQFLQDV